MSATHFDVQVGQIACTILLDGASLLGRERILKRFRDATEAEYRQAYVELGLSLDEADTSFNILVARIGEHTVLVDTGEAGKPYGGLLLASMEQAGIDPQAITLVVLTHADGDHVQGILTDANEPAFPNATYVISKPEMDYWRSRIDMGALDHQAIIELIERAGLRLIDLDEEILPGLRAISIAGHTPGQIAVVVESDDQKLIDLSDLLHTPMQFAHPEWSSSFDRDTSQSVPTRHRALGLAADEHMLALFYHLTFPGLGRVKRAGTGFIWEPIQM